MNIESPYNYGTAAAILNGRPITLEEAKVFVCESKWAHDERNSLRNTVVDLRNEIVRRDTEIAMLKDMLLEYETPEIKNPLPVPPQ